MAQQSKIGSHATTVAAKKNTFRITYHNTDVVTFDEKTITLDSGGWRTATTKTRMNQASNQFGLGYTVFQKKGEWFVQFDYFTVPFEDGIVLKR